MMNYMRESEVIIRDDAAGQYEIEIFDADSPRGVIVCSHGNGVRRWDGKHFFHNVAQHYHDYIIMLVDQNQLYKDGCKLNDLAIMVSRVQLLITMAKRDYPNLPVTVMAHSMGCGVAAKLDLSDVVQVIFIAPAAGDQRAKLHARYGDAIASGMEVKTSEGSTKFIPKEFYDSVEGIVWEREYEKLLQRFPRVYVYESGDEEIVGEERFAHRNMPFASYEIIPGAAHNFSGEALQKLFANMDVLLLSV